MDSFEGNGETPQTLHKYSYCQNDPINSSDPSGRDGEALTVADILTTMATFKSPSEGSLLPEMEAKLRDRPKEKTRRQLVAAIFAESSALDWRHKLEDSIEKYSIGATIINQAFYAQLPPGSKQTINWNAKSGFGDGTIYSKYLTQ